MAPAVQEKGIGCDDGLHPRRSRAPRHPPRSLFVGGRASGIRCDRGGGRAASRPGSRLRRHAGAAQRRIARRLGTRRADRSEEHTSELQSLMRLSYAVFCLKKKKKKTKKAQQYTTT